MVDHSHPPQTARAHPSSTATKIFLNIAKSFLGHTTSWLMVQAGTARKGLWSYCLWDQLPIEEGKRPLDACTGNGLSGEHMGGNSACLPGALMKWSSCCFTMLPHVGFFLLPISFPQTRAPALKLKVSRPMIPFRIFSPKCLSWAMLLGKS